MSAASGILSSSWILDSGATHHMTSDATRLVDLVPTHLTSQVRTADGTLLSVTQSGRLTPTSTSPVSLPTVHHVPGLALSLISVSQLTDLGLTVTFTSSACVVQDRLSGQRIGIGHRVGGLYYLDRLQLSPSTPTASASVLAVVSSPDRWHRRLGHLSSARLKLLSSSGVLGHVSSSPLSTCMGCRLAKHLALPFSSSESVSVASFDLVHSDI